MDTLFADAIQRLLEQHVTPATVRAIEAGQDAGALYAALEASGFLDALVSEAHGGAGLDLAAVHPLLHQCGYRAVPAPVAATTIARALLRAGGDEVPTGFITLAGTPAILHDGCITVPDIPCGRVAGWVLAALPEGVALLPTARARQQEARQDAHPDTHHDTHAATNLRARYTWDRAAARRVHVAADALWPLGALIATVQLAGAARRALEMTLEHAGTRQQFGKPIGKFQAIQQQISVMAEQVCAMDMAGRLACRGDPCAPDPLAIGAGKARASEAAAEVCAIAHAVHGAMGITAEHDLQLYTRRLLEWRTDHGSERYWQGRLGRALLAGNQSALDFMRSALFHETA
ncbi:MAG: acyl-CoA dehydrogenase [Proteobacteria bacterium]|nr:acyl-CoA dehydrogenase [Pseudomonadota bacterium]HQR03659.1 acyl-CoA dehydrogenase [Rhodocyclaceae bacterium]